MIRQVCIKVGKIIPFGGLYIIFFNKLNMSHVCQSLGAMGIAIPGLSYMAATASAAERVEALALPIIYQSLWIIHRLGHYSEFHRKHS